MEMLTLIDRYGDRLQMEPHKGTLRMAVMWEEEPPMPFIFDRATATLMRKRLDDFLESLPASDAKG